MPTIKEKKEKSIDEIRRFETYLGAAQMLDWFQERRKDRNFVKQEEFIRKTSTDAWKWAVHKGDNVTKFETNSFDESFMRSYQVLSRVHSLLREGKTPEEVLEFIGLFYKRFE